MQTPSQNKGSELIFFGLMLFAALLLTVTLSKNHAGFKTSVDDSIIAAMMKR